MLTLALLAGLWSTTCIQTQINHDKQGFVIESYEIKAKGEFEFRRDWYRDENCIDSIGHEAESGTIEIGQTMNSFFSPAGSTEANFSTQKGVDLGALLLQNNSLRVARGVPNNLRRNTMLSLFLYSKK